LNDKKRNEIKNLLAEINNNDSFTQFLLLNLYKDIPSSYVEDFEYIKKFYLPYIKKKKIIFSMSSIWVNDNFKIFVAESKKLGSKLIYCDHGGQFSYFDERNDEMWLKKIAHKIITWNKYLRSDLHARLSPTLPVVKFKKKNTGIYCSIIFVEQSRYVFKFLPFISLNQSIDFFYDLTDFVDKLNPDIKSRVKFRAKTNRGFNAGRKFSEIFGKESIDKFSFKNPFYNTLLNSKLIIATYPQTAFCEAMFSNVPTILVINKKHYQFTKEAQHIFDILKANQIAFEDFNSAREHVNKYWYKIDEWWKKEDVQRARKMFLKSFFNVKPNWYKEWSNYIRSLKKF